VKEKWEFDPESLTKEMQFMLTLLRDEGDPEVREFIRARAAAIDWQQFMKCVHHHKVYPLVYALLQSYPEVVPDHVMQSLREHRQRNMFRMLSLSAELRRVCARFHNSGVRFLVLKGPMLAQELYGDISMRASKDLDLLVSLKDVERAEYILGQLGYTALPGGMPRVFGDWRWREHHRSYRHPATGTLVELHWRMHPHVHHEPSFERLWESRTSVETGDTVIHTLSDTDHFLYLIVHGARHGWFRLRWLIDISRMMRTLDEGKWRIVLSDARRLQAASMLGQSLYLVSRLLHVPLPGELERLAVTLRSLKHARDSLEYIRDMVNLHPGPETKRLAAHYKRYLFSLLTFRKKVVYVISALYPNSWDTLHFPLPRRLYFLYIPLRPFLWLWKMMQHKWMRKDGVRHKGAGV